MRGIDRIVVLAAVLALAGCAAVAPRPPEVRLARLDRIDRTPSGVAIGLTLAVHNRNAYPLRIGSLHLALAVDDLPLAQGDTAAAVTVPASGDAELPLDVMIDGGALLRLLPLLANGGSQPYALDGDAEVGGITLPFHDQGSVALPRRN